MTESMDDARQPNFETERSHYQPGDVIMVRRAGLESTLHLHYALYIGSFDGREIVINLENRSKECCCYCADCEELSDDDKSVCRVKDLSSVSRNNDSAALSSCISAKPKAVSIPCLKSYLLECALRKDCAVIEDKKAQYPCKQFVLDFLDECGLELRPAEPDVPENVKPVMLDDENGALAGCGFSTQVERVFNLLYLMFPVVTIVGGVMFRVLKFVAKR